MTETQLKIKVLDVLRRKYPNGFFYKTSDKFVSGVPDILGWIPGKSLAFELKVGRNKATPIQLYTLRKMQEAGVVTGVAYSVEDVLKIINGE